MNLLKGNSPPLNVKEIQDPYIQKNFRVLQDYFNQENQLLGFNFVEVNITSAVSQFAVAHGCGFVPQDVIVTRITGAGVASFLYPIFDANNIYITTTGACRIRMFIGTFWGQQTTLSNNASDAQQWAATVSSAASSSSSSTSTSTSTTSTVVSSSSAISNLGLSAVCGVANGNALTITLTQSDGASSPSASGPVIVPFRGAVVTSSASWVQRKITTPLSITVPSGTAMGNVQNAISGGANQYVWVYLIDDNGVIDIGVSGNETLFDDSFIQNTTAMSPSANSGATIYSTIAHTGCPIRMIGRVSISSFLPGNFWTTIAQVDALPTPRTVTEEWAQTRTFVPSSGWGTRSSESYWTRRNGRMLECLFYWKGGTLTATTGTIALPSGYRIDINFLPNFTQGQVILGMANGSASGATSYGPNGMVAYVSWTDASTLYLGARGATFGVEITPVNAWCPATPGMLVQCSFPVQGWSPFGAA